MLGELFSVLPFRQTLFVRGAQYGLVLIPLGEWDCNIGMGPSCSSVSSLLSATSRLLYLFPALQCETASNTASSHLIPPSFVSKSLLTLAFHSGTHLRPPQQGARGRDIGFVSTGHSNHRHHHHLQFSSSSQHPPGTFQRYIIAQTK